ncbi:hypothetical protein K2173_015530 [Erythroxylum novogranatense]|uniref:Cytochrome P450 n=1 Tax=Erythroxylum novogranatense TaxID=1862640 RepID=A0AAV8SSH4_9ROSI|nr:hypothetical protein K2173_015530 [Erythroxylum novogranatense]
MELQLSFFYSLVSLFFIIITVLKISKTSSREDLDLNLLPGPWRLPLIGNLHQLVGSTSPHHRLRDLAKKYGPFMRVQLGEVSTIVVSSAEYAKEVMGDHDTIFANRPFILAASLISYDHKNIACSPLNNYWRELRKICISELLSPKRVLSFRSIREEEVLSLLRYISKNVDSPVNLSEKISSTTYGITSRAAFSRKYDEQQEFIHLVDGVIKVAEGFSIADSFPSLKLVHRLGGMMGQIEKIHKQVDKVLETIITEHRSKKMTKNSTEGEVEEDLVDVLLKIQETGCMDSPFADDNIKAVILDVFIAGSETSSKTVAWALSEVLRNPEIITKAQAEVRQVFSKKGKVEESGLGELKYLKMVIKETLRLHPPAPLLLPRESSEKCTISGYDIPSKTKVIVNAWAIARDPNYWTEAETFMPERFLDSSVDYKGSNFEFIPFGAGRRICPGMSLGLINVELPLASLLYHFDWKSPDDTSLENLDMTEDFGATVGRKNDLRLVPVSYIPVPAE